MSKLNYGNLPGPGDLWDEDEETCHDKNDQPDDEPEDWEADMKDTSCMDYEYDPLSRKGFE